MTGWWLRVSIFVAILGAVAIGIWDFFKAPSPETAVAAFVPTVEEVQRAQVITDPVVDFVAEQDQESVTNMLRDAHNELQASLDEPGSPVQLIEEVRQLAENGELLPPRDVVHSVDAQPTANSATGTHLPPVEPGTQPGIDWYRGER